MRKKLKTILATILMTLVFPFCRADGDPPEGPAAAGPPAAPPEEHSAGAGPGIAELEEMLAARSAELATANARLSGLEQSLAAGGRKIEELGGSLETTLGHYKTLLAAVNPDVPPELLTGQSVAELGASLAAAKELVDKVRANLEEQSRQTRVPPGSPPRGPVDDSRLSPREKIVRGLENRR